VAVSVVGGFGPGAISPSAEENAGPPTVRSAECRWASGPIKIDGTLDEPAWQKAQVLKDFAAYWEHRPAKTATRARLLWDENYIYFAAEMEDSDLYADVTQRNGMTWLNDVFELFFKPSDKKLAYYEFQVNAANTQLELFLPSRGSGGYQRFAPLTRFGMESAVKLEGTLNNPADKDKAWTVEGRIPLSAFLTSGAKPQPSTKWRFALCRYDYSVAFEHVETSSTAPLTQPDFHRYEDYGELTFVGQ
jgi:hypothetical protein